MAGQLKGGMGKCRAKKHDKIYREAQYYKPSIGKQDLRDLTKQICNGLETS
jgi:hypothetical protein